MPVLSFRGIRMFWRILPHVTLCIADDRIIMLDVLGDRYLQVPDGLFSPTGTWLNAGENVSPPDAFLSLLKRNEVFRDGDAMPSNTARDRVRIPTNPMSPVWGHKDGGRSTLSVAAAMMTTWTSLHLRGLAAILRDHHHCNASARQQHPDLLELSARFERSRRFSPIARRCLIDTLALDTWLSDAGQACQIVFGVTAAPFRAHCWLQAPVGVLNDSFDHVTRYTPILTV